MKNLKENRLGEYGCNKFGSNMQIVEYNNANDIIVEFTDYNFRTHATYTNFKNGSIKCPYEKRYCGKGYLGIGEYKMSEGGQFTQQYKTWYNMLIRCYNIDVITKYPTYQDCYVCDEWLNFQNFAKWYDENYYNVKNEPMHLDKDILIKYNKKYSPETCIFVPQRINVLFIKSDSARGNFPIGVTFRNGKYTSYCHDADEYKIVRLGVFCTAEDAFIAYKTYKERVIKHIADKYKDYIPTLLYEALYKYTIEIDD